jgi:hypothetical protein
VTDAEADKVQQSKIKENRPFMQELLIFAGLSQM